MPKIFTAIMQVAHKDWTSLVNKCEVFKSQVPLPACSDSAGEAAEGIPSCSSTDSTSVRPVLLLAEFLVLLLLEFLKHACQLPRATSMSQLVNTGRLVRPGICSAKDS